MTGRAEPKYPRVTPRHTIVMPDEVWEQVMELARRRSENASLLLRKLAMDELARARATGEMPKAWRIRRKK